MRSGWHFCVYLGSITFTLCCRGNIVLYQNGKSWQDGARECAVVKVGRYNTHYTLKPFAFDASSSQRTSLGDIRYVDRIKACLSPRK